LSLLFTGVERRLLAEAPGYALLATRQSCGKTTLARRAHVILTRHDMPVTTFAENEEEMQKRLLAAFSRSPTMMCFDNLRAGSTLQSSTLALAMTSGLYRQRVLGVNEERDVASDVLMVITANNLKLGGDENTRWLTAWLEPSVLRPEKRVFVHPDVVGHALKIREEVLRDVLGIISGYLMSGQRIERGSRFNRWDRLVRQPLLWAGARDIGEVFETNTNVSEDEKALGLLVNTLQTLHGEEWFGARDAVRGVEAEMGESPTGAALEEALTRLGVKNVHSTGSVGMALGAAVGKPTLSRLQLVTRLVLGRNEYAVQPWKEGMSHRADDLA
jgi:hypothetical protein